jgi:hypothetical protein
VANYDARINVTADTRQAATAIEQLEARVNRVNQLANLSFDARFRISGLEQALRTVNEVENAVLSLRSQARSISAPGAGALGDAFRVAARQANDFFDTLANGRQNLANTISGLNEQSRAFANLAANIDSADRRFTDYIQGAQAAQDKGLRPLFRQFEALRRLYQDGLTGLNTDISSNQIGIQFFERLRNEVPNTTRALQAYSAELQRIIGLVESGSATAIGAEQELIRVETQILEIEQQRLETRAALNRETSSQVQSALSSMQGRGANPFGISDEQVNDTLNARADAYVRQNEEIQSLMRSLSAMEGKAADPFNISDQQINAGLEERANLYVKQADELDRLRTVLEQMSGKKYDPLGITDEQINAGLNERASLYEKQSQDLGRLMNALAAMEGRAVDPFGISDSQINAALDQRASDYEIQVRETANLQQALQQLESRRVDWGTILGIDVSDVAARKAQELSDSWNRLQQAADQLASQSSEAAAALNKFKFESLSRDADAYTRAILNQNAALREYVDQGGRNLSVTSNQSEEFRRAALSAREYANAIDATQGLGYQGQFPALRPAGFTSQDVRVKNMLDDEAKLAKMLAETEIDLDKMVSDLQIENNQRVLDAALDDLERLTAERIKADEKFWAAAKRNLDENDARQKEQTRIDQLPFLEKRFGKRGSAAISEGLIGGAFPLLFGQGLGASVGGGLGGALGGFAGGGLGFGLSLIGTAVGTAIDTVSTNLRGLASALKEPSAALEAMRTAGLRVTPEIEDLVARLEGIGAASAAQNVVLKELERQLGAGAVVQLRALNQEQKRLESEWQELNATLVNSLLPTLIGVTSAFGDFVSVINVLTSIKPPDWVEDLADAYFEASKAVIPGGLQLSDLRFGPQYAFAAKNLRERASSAAGTAKPAGPELTPEAIRRQELFPSEQIVASLQARLNSLDLVKNLSDQIRSVAREQEDLDRERYDLIESYERSISEIRLNVERRIQQQQQQNLQLQNEAYSVQGEIRLQQLRNENAAIAEGLRGNTIGQQAFEIVSEYTEKQLSTENEIANRRRSLEAEIQSINIESDQFKIDVARQVAELNRSTAKQIEQIQLGILRRNQDYDKNRFEIEKQIAVARLQTEKITAAQSRETLRQALANEKDPTRQASLEQSIRNLDALLTDNSATGFSGLINQVSRLQAPSAVALQPTAVGSSVSTAEIESLAARSIELKKRIAELQSSISDLVKAGDIQALNSSFLSLADQGAAELTASFQDARFELKQILDLVSPGEVSPRLRGLQAGLKAAFESPGIQSSPFVKEFKQLFDFYGKLAEQNEKLIATTKFFEESISSNTEEISSLKEEVNELVGGFTAYEQALTSLAQRGLSPASEEAQELLASAKEIDRVRDKIEVITAFRDAAIGLSDSLKGLVSDFVQLGSASEAVKAFNQRISSGVTNFVLELAFKPVEQALQKQFFAFAEELGFDVKPEALKQLEEIQTIRQTTALINKGVSDLVAAMTGPMAGVRVTPTDNANVNVYTMPDGSTFTGSQEAFESQRKAIEELIRRQQPSSTGGYPAGTPQSQMLLPGNDMPSYRPPFAPGGPIPRNLPAWDPRWGNPVRGLSDDELKRRYEGRTINSLPGDFTGIGGPDLPRQVFPIPDEPVKVEVVNPAAGLVPLSESSTGVTRLQVTPYGTTPSATSPVPAGMGQRMNEDAIKYGEGVKQVTGATQQAATGIVGSGNKAAAGALTWQKSLGQVVTGLGLAASSVIGIVGGVQQIQQGGTGNVLSGIGSILTTVGGIGMSLAGGLGGLFGGGGGAGGGGFPVTGLDFLGGASPLPGSFAAKGAIFANGMARFAKGGVVNSPTLFQFANGGSLNNGLMGEAGPEAIMPLKRGSDGRLGVAQVSDGGAQRRHEAMGGSPAQQKQSVDFNLKFETTMINGVEYVSKDQLDQAMAQTRRASISEGAKRGMSMTLDKLQQSPSTRSRVGIR